MRIRAIRVHRFRKSYEECHDLIERANQMSILQNTLRVYVDNIAYLILSIKTKNYEGAKYKIPIDKKLLHKLMERV